MNALESQLRHLVRVCETKGTNRNKIGIKNDDDDDYDDDYMWAT